VLCALLAGLLVGAPAQAAVGYTTTMTFDKNPSDPTNSRLFWRVYRVEENGSQRKIVDVSWRAGSGNGSTDSCYRNNGWLPNGYYDTTLYMNYNGSVIDGVAFRLSDKKCHNGTPRTELFVHSEMTTSGGQNCNVERECWNGNGDYKSAGCIKLKPADIKSLASYYRQYHAAGSTIRGKLAVIS